MSYEQGAVLGEAVFQEIIPFIATLIIGEIDITAEATDDESGMDKVEFCIDGELKYTDEDPGYIYWTWDEPMFLRHKIKLTAIDAAGNKANDEITVWKLL